MLPFKVFHVGFLEGRERDTEQPERERDTEQASSSAFRCLIFKMVMVTFVEKHLRITTFQKEKEDLRGSLFHFLFFGFDV